MKRIAILLALFLPLLAIGQVVPPAVPLKGGGRGHVTPANIKELHAASWAKHGRRLSALPKVTAPSWDCRTLGIVGPVKDQGQCGSCWLVSETGVIESAFIKAGYFKADGSTTLSDQYVLDGCGPRTGGCDGDDASTVSLWCRDHGLPTTADYGPYTATPGRCKTLKPGAKLWKIDSQGYCAQQDGIAPTQSIKDAIVAYGPISSAVAAGGFDAYKSGVMAGGTNCTADDVDHDVSIIGWDDNKVSPDGAAKGAWLVKNQWSKSWGEGGYCWISYGRWMIGFSALWAHATPIDPPTPTPPTPPTPPSQYTPPFYLRAAGAKGTPYVDVPTATVAAQKEAVKCQCAVEIEDFKGVLVATITPNTPPVPPAPPNPANSFTIKTPGTYVLVAPKTADAIRDSGLSVDDYVAASERFLSEFRRHPQRMPKGDE